MHQKTLCDAVCVIFGFCLFAFMTPPQKINNLELGINIESSGVCKWSNEFDVLCALAWRMARAHWSGWFYLLWSDKQNESSQ